MSIRRVESLLVPEGDGLRVRRLMPVHELRNFDPFVLWDHFDIEGGGFPPHPHRGFEAITWLFSGGMQHADNLGNQGTIHADGAQRFTAGSGIVHSEMPDGKAAGIQLWINLPRRLKGIEPTYQQVEGIKPETSDGIEIRNIVGEAGAIELNSHIEYLDIRMQPGTSFSRHVTPGFRGIIYVVSGHIELLGQTATDGQALLVEHEAELSLLTKESTHLLWCFGAPHGEPIRQHGPFVD